MLKYFSMAAMLAVLIVFTTLGMTKENIKIVVDENILSQNDEIPVVLLRPKLHNLTPEARKQIECLAGNIFFEARSEPVKGQIAVAFVTLNRVNSASFPDNICDVVKQKTKSTCQFSWYCEYNPKRQYYSKQLTNRQKEVYNDIVNLSLFVYANYEKLSDPTFGSLYYHANYVNPRWNHLDRIAVIGNHIFYRTRENGRDV